MPPQILLVSRSFSPACPVPQFPQRSPGHPGWCSKPGGVRSVPVPAHEAGSPCACAVVHLHEVKAAVLVGLQAEVVEVEVDDVAHGHRDLPEAQLQGRGQPGTVVKPGRGTSRLCSVGGCLPPSHHHPPPTSIPARIPSLTCWCGYGRGWFGVEKCPSKAVSGPPHSGGTHTHMQLCPLTPFPPPFTLAPLFPVPASHQLDASRLWAGPGSPLCFRLQLASSLLSAQSWKPSQRKPRWRQSPWSHKCSSQAQLSAVKQRHPGWHSVGTLPCLNALGVIGVPTVPGGGDAHSRWEAQLGSGH